MRIHQAPVVLAEQPIKDGGIAVEDGRIVAVGPIKTLPNGEVLEHHGILAPGLINAHTHLNYSGSADLYGNGKPFPEWIAELAGRIPNTTPEQWRDATAAGAQQAIAAGTTAVADVATSPAAFDALAASGLSGIGYLELVFLDAERWAARRDSWLADLDKAIAGDFPAGVSPHTVYTLTPEILREASLIARERGLRLHPHASETTHELEFTARGTGAFADWVSAGGLAHDLVGTGSGRTPIEELAEAGLLGADCHVAHGVHCGPADRARLRAAGVTVALCVRSNARLASGDPPVAAYRAEGSSVAVGTDALASSPDLDLLAEARALRALALRQGSPERGLDEWIFKALSAGGAQALGRADLGVLQTGARADFAVFDVPTTGDPYAALINEGAGSCVATYLAGACAWTR